MRKSIVFAIVFIFFVSSAYAGDVLRILTWKGYTPRKLVEKFEKQTGIKVEITYSNNEEMIAKLRATRGGGFDLAQPSQDRISAVQAKYHIYRPMDYSKINNALFIPSMLKAVKKNTFVNGKSYAVPFCWGTSGLIVNKKYAPDAKDYTVLLNPKYKGRISYRLKRPTLIALAFAFGYNPFKLYNSPEKYRKLMEMIGKKMIKAKNLVKTYWTNGDILLQLMRNNEVYVAMGWDGGGWKLHKENPNIDYVAPKSGALGWIDTFAIPAKSQNIEAAYKWINFIVQPENAAYFTNKEGYYAASKEAENYLKPDVRASLKRSFSKSDIENIKWYPPVPAKIEEIEAKILDEVRAAR